MHACRQKKEKGKGGRVEGGEAAVWEGGGKVQVSAVK